MTRRPDPRDRRARQVLITDPGRARFSQVRQNLAAAESRLLIDLDAEQLRTFLSRVARTARREPLAPTEADC